MTDRISAFTVILDKDLRDDDAQLTIDAIAQIKGVLTVEPAKDPNMLASIVANARIRQEIGAKLYDVVWGHEVTDEES